MSLLAPKAAPTPIDPGGSGNVGNARPQETDFVNKGSNCQPFVVPLAADGSEDDRGIEDDRGNIGSNFQTFVAPMAAEGMKDCGISVLGPGIGLVVLENVGKSLLVLGAAHAS